MDNTQKKEITVCLRIAISLILLGLSIFAESCFNHGEKENEFTKVKMGESWPFKDIESGVVSCSPEGGVIFEASNGKTYALNGWAKTLRKTKYPEWVDSGEIQIVGKDVGPILSKGLSLCESNK